MHISDGSGLIVVNLVAAQDCGLEFFVSVRAEGMQ